MAQASSTKLNGESLDVFTEASRAESAFGLTLISPGEASVALVNRYKLKGLILAQNERWRRGLGMQVARETN